jgi:hypothetical protein
MEFALFIQKGNSILTQESNLNVVHFQSKANAIYLKLILHSNQSPSGIYQPILTILLKKRRLNPNIYRNIHR